MAGFSVEAGDPAAVEVFQGGVSHGRLIDPVTPLAKAGQAGD
jgi:hypothetical protein